MFLSYTARPRHRFLHMQVLTARSVFARDMLRSIFKVHAGNREDYTKVSFVGFQGGS